MEPPPAVDELDLLLGVMAVKFGGTAAMVAKE
jgi:hypothetical protein